MRRQYRGHLRQVTNDIQNAALQASSLQVKEWSNLSTTMQRLVQQGTPRGRAQCRSSHPAIFSTPGRPPPTATLRSPPSTSMVTSKSTANVPPVLVHCNMLAPATRGFDNPRPSTSVRVHEHHEPWFRRTINRRYTFSHRR